MQQKILHYNISSDGDDLEEPKQNETPLIVFAEGTSSLFLLLISVRVEEIAV